jgi:hypothetical protein
MRIGEQTYLVSAFLHEHGYDITSVADHKNHYALGGLVAWQIAKTTITITDRYSHEVFLEARTDTSVVLWSHIRPSLEVDLYHPHSLPKILEYVRSHRTVLLEGV